MAEASAGPDGHIVGSLDIAMRRDGEVMKVEIDGRQKLGFMYLRIHEGAEYDPEKHGPDAMVGEYPKRIRDVDLGALPNRNLFLEVGLIYGRNPSHLLIKGRRTEQQKAEQKARTESKPPRADDAMRVFVKKTLRIAKKPSFYVGCKLGAESTLAARRIKLDKVFFYEEIWDEAMRQGKTQKWKVARLLLGTASVYLAAVNKESGPVVEPDQDGMVEDAVMEEDAGEGRLFLDFSGVGDESVDDGAMEHDAMEEDLENETAAEEMDVNDESMDQEITEAMEEDQSSEEERSEDQEMALMAPRVRESLLTARNMDSVLADTLANIEHMFEWDKLQIEILAPDDTLRELRNSIGQSGTGHSASILDELEQIPSSTQARLERVQTDMQTRLLAAKQYISIYRHLLKAILEAR